MSRKGLTELLARLRASDVKLALDGERLKCDAPKGVLTPALQRELAEYKEELLALLRASRQPPRVPPLVPRPPGVEVPLSYAQEGAWFIDQLQPGVAFNIVWPMHLAGRLDEECLALALGEMVRRHAVLRTTLEAVDGRPRQVIHPPRGMPLAFHDLTGLPAGAREAEAQRLVLELAQRPFVLARGPLVAMHVLRLGRDEQLLLLVVHHSVFDGWSIKVFAQEFSAAYEAFVSGRMPQLPPLAVEYADYAVWQRELLSGEYYDAQLRYWREQLADCPSGLALACDRRPSGKQLFEGAVASRQFSPELIRGLRDLAQREGLTLFMLLAAAFKSLLLRYTGQEDIVVGTPIANRSQPEMAGVIGFCVNLLALRTSLAGNPTFRDLAARERRTCLGAFDHQELPFGKLVQELDPVRGIGHSPFFQVQFALHETQNYAVNLPGLVAVSHGGSARPADDVMGLLARAQPATDHLFLNIVDTGAEVGAWMHYRADLFTEASVRRMLAHLERLLAAIADNPDCGVWDLPLLAADERRLLVDEFSRGAPAGPPGACIHELFEEQVRRSPEAAAVIVPADEGQELQLTYAGLNRRANQLARHLRSLGIGCEDRVGICLDRSADLFVAVWGVLKAGAALVPLDAGYSSQRLADMIADAGLALLITGPGLLDERFTSGVRTLLPSKVADEIASHSDGDLGLAADDRQLAYVVYTSGSTGKPKGVMVTHRSLVSAFRAWESAYALREKRSHLQMASFSFDVFVGDLVRAHCSGARLVVCPRESLLMPDRLAALLQHYAIDCAEFVPAVVRVLIEHLQQTGQRLDALKLAMVGSDTWHAAEYAQVRSIAARQARVINSYGVAEATIDSSYFEDGTSRPLGGTSSGESPGPLTADGPLPIGRPFAGCELFVLDRCLAPAPIGVPGELYLGGAGLARGYVGRPGQTAERFVPHPFGRRPGERLYRTGDRARWLADGNLEFLGRVDQQIKIRGFRIEPAEVEAAIGEHPSVKQAVVIALAESAEGARGEQRLVAYLTAKDGAALAEAELRRFLDTRLPSYMVPSALVVLDELPLSPNGKVNRRALPAPSADQVSGRKEYVPPRTLTELALAGVWSEVLGAARVGIHDDFFALGGHSLLAARLVARIRRALAVELPLRSVFEHPTLAGMARAVDAARGDAAALLPPIEPVPRDGRLPLSYAQEGAWLVDQLQPGVPFNIPLPLHLKGPLDLPRLERALARVVARHEALRTSFAAADGQPYQAIAREARTPLAVVDLRHLPADQRRRELIRRLLDAAGQPFDLGQYPLARLIVYRLADDEQVLLFVAHHIVFDGHSVGIFARDLTAIYTADASGSEPALPELPIQYADYAAWQRRVLSGEFLEAELAYWRKQLADYPTGLNLPTERRPAGGELYRGDTVSALLSEQESAALRELAQREGVTVFMLLLAAYKALLARYSGQEDILVGTPVANRNQPEMADVIGFCVNMLVLRTSLAGNPTFRELLAREREVCLSAYTHQEVPLGLLVQHLKPDRHLTHSPFFSVGFAHQPAPPQTDVVGGLELAPAVDADAQALLEELERRRADVTPATDLLFLQTADTGRQLAAIMHHNSAAFSPETIERMMSHFRQLLAGIAAEPETRLYDIPLLDAAGRQRVLVDWNAARIDVPRGVAVHQLFEAQTEQNPDAVAVIVPVGPDKAEGQLTYGQLNRRANQLARHLRSLGITSETRVGICLDRNADLLVAVWAVLKAGAAYVPLDPAQGSERLAYMLAAAGVAIVITAEGLLDPAAVACPMLDLAAEAAAIAAEDDANLNLPVDDRQLAYAIFTSGSTGRPKGVMVAHRSLVNAYCAWQEAYGLAGLRRHLQMASFSFDVFSGDLVRAHASGAALVLCPRESLLAPDELLELTGRYEIDCAEFVPAVVRSLVEHLQSNNQQLDSLRLAIVGSDSWYAREYDELARLLPDGSRLVNSYGVAEVTIDSTWYESDTAGASGDAMVPIGRPFANSRAYVLDGYLNPVPVGAAGELYLGGPGLARGYVGRPDLTAERFVPDPFGREPGCRLYRTGDRARYMPDGTLELLGRIDHQIKIRGFRIEPGEVEAALGEHPAVRQAVVVAHRHASDEMRLVAYVARAEGAELTTAELRAFLEAKLPPYMVPAAMLVLDELPLSPSGKVDRRALPDPAGLKSQAGAEYVAPQTATEIELARLFGEVLDVERVGTRDNFFALGGHSLLAARLVARVRRDMGIQLPLRALFEHPTVAGLAHAVDQGLLTRLADDADLDLAREATLPGDITPGGLAPWDGAEPKHVFLTGATGFLGAYLLHELLAQTSACVHCLVRADNEAQARERLQAALARFDLWDEQAAARIVPVLGDLARPQLGLGDDELGKLAETIDVIYHNGAWVNFLYPYAVLKQANVGGTEEVLRLACRAKLKPVHYVSTLSVFPPSRWMEGSVVESFHVEPGPDLRGGYAQSKWVAERLVALASERGVPVTIHRPGRVTGDSRTGATSETQGLENLNALVRLGVVPRVDWPTTLDVVPVDYVARAIVALASQPGSLGKAFHLNNPQPGAWPDMVAALRRAGYELREIDPREWAVRVYEFIRATPTHAWHEALPFIPPQIGELLAEWSRTGDFGDAVVAAEVPAPASSANGQPRAVDCRNTLAGLASCGIACPPAAELLDVYLAWLIQSGELEPPHALHTEETLVATP
jgi:amino acid adenylation domain-containing protein/thioester reductase-like protein